MLDFWICLSVIVPVIFGVVAFLDKSNGLQRVLVIGCAGAVMLSAIAISFTAPAVTQAQSGLAAFLQIPILVLDFVLLGLMLYIGLRRKNASIVGLAAIQLVGLFILKTFFHAKVSGASLGFMVDGISATMVLVVSFVGSAIAYYGIGYMKEHEAHLHLAESKCPRFFAVIFIFLGAMNGLSLADDLSWIFFFWEVTTLCSYLLIAHDDTPIANKNAENALLINLGGGVAFIAAMLFLQRSVGTLSLVELMTNNANGGIRSVVLMTPIVALAIAAFTKSAQIPFQSWLCGAMVAPTPVSALLHSSTMVNAGVYLILRLSPLYAGSAVSSLIAIFGAFSFLAAAALAVGQSNGKKVLAYSTISNLGLIIACAGINTKTSIAAGMMLLVFHAVSKGLIFMCVGAIEQKIGSRSIESMRGLFTVMPRTALITVFGIFTMMLPPFGMLLAKWMSLESAVEARAAMPIIVAMLALGSGLTVLFWARWAGVILISATPNLKVPAEPQDVTISRPLHWLAYGVAALSLVAPMLYMHYVSMDFAHLKTAKAYIHPGVLYVVYPLYALLAYAFWYAWNETKKAGDLPKSIPYMSGMQAEQGGVVGFTGPMKGFVESSASNYYLDAIFGEDKVTRTINIVGIALLVMMLGGVLQ